MKNSYHSYSKVLEEKKGNLKRSAEEAQKGTKRRKLSTVSIVPSSTIVAPSQPPMVTSQPSSIDIEASSSNSKKKKQSKLNFSFKH